MTKAEEIGSGKAQKAVTQLQICVFQFVNKIATKFQVLQLSFQSSSSNGTIVIILYNQTEKTESGKSKMAACKLKIHLSQLVYITREQRHSKC